MFEVKYPLSHKLDGKIHSIIIIEAQYYKGHILVYGKSLKDERMVMEIKYFHEYASWIMIPRDINELSTILENSGKGIDVTQYMKQELEGKQIKNIEELDYLFPVQTSLKNEDEMKKMLSQYKYYNVVSEEELSEAIKKIFKVKDEIPRPINTEEVFSITIRKAYALISTFTDEIEEYDDKEKKAMVSKFIQDIFDTLLELPHIMFTEDELIDLGNILVRLKKTRLKGLSEEEFLSIIDEGYELINKLKARIKTY